MPISIGEPAAATVAAGSVAPAWLVRDATTRRRLHHVRSILRPWLVSVQVTTRSIIRERMPAAT